MISPASGIHRPSYNGAPAILTLNNYDGSCLATDSRIPCASTCAARRRIARQRIY